MRRPLLVALGAVSALAVATPSPTLAQSLVRGRAAYRERVALRPGVVFEATLEDVSRVDAGAVVLGRVRVEDVGAVPIPFEIPYDPAQIDERHAYSVRGRLLAGERLLFTTDRAAPVLTRGHGNEVELLLVRVPSTTPHEKGTSPP